MPARFGEVTLSRTLANAIEHSSAVQRFIVDGVAARAGWTCSDLTGTDVRHSYMDGALDTRETDILLAFSSNGSESHWVLIEVKINAPFGRQQPEDYVRRKEKAIALKRCGRCAAVVIAPDAYLRAHPADVGLFDLAISLEDIQGAAAPAADLAAKLLGNHITMALDLFAAGYIPLQDTLREAQIAWYDAFVQDYKPHLVPNPTNSSKQTRDRFFPVPWQKRGYITHRIFAGEVSAGFMQRSHLLGELTASALRYW